MECNAVACPLHNRCPHVAAKTAEQCSRLNRKSDIHYLPIDDCDDGGVYELHAKCAGVGIFHSATSTFEYAQSTLSNTSTFEEKHFDAGGGANATARPVRKLTMAPEFDSVQQKLDFLEQVELRIRETELHG
ncbi:MAG: hypothetical protein GF334_01040 [Candidatus Altiarchaeales archaeon]|nr:hypothetical protein [Candidatus Altiarchaeales archaeon]